MFMRMCALTHRGKVFHSLELNAADMELKREDYTLHASGNSCVLTHREFQLMEFLMQNFGMFFSVDALLEKVWGADAKAEQGTVWVHMFALRKKLESLEAHAMIVSRRGIGYALQKK